MRDSGLVHALLGIASLEQHAGHPVVAESWAGYVVETLLGVLPPLAEPHFYRTIAGAEIDLAIDHADGERWAIEIKRSLSAKVRRGFHLACEDIEPTRAFAVHAGDDRYPVTQGVEGIGVRELARRCGSVGEGRCEGWFLDPLSRAIGLLSPLKCALFDGVNVAPREDVLLLEPALFNHERYLRGAVNAVELFIVRYDKRDDPLALANEVKQDSCRYKLTYELMHQD